MELTLTGGPDKAPKRSRLWRLLPALSLLLCGTVALWPDLRSGVCVLLNRLFEASEAVNSYVYDRLPQADGAMPQAATALLGLAFGALLLYVLTAARRWPSLLMMAALCVTQAWLGLTLPSWLLIPLLLLLGLKQLLGLTPRGLILPVSLLLALLLLTSVLLPGVHETTEQASERVRDSLSRMWQRDGGTVTEDAAGQTPVRPENRRTLAEGETEVQTGEAFTLQTLAQVEVALPQWVSLLRTVLLILAVPLALTLPFVPFLWMSLRRRKASEALSRLLEA